MYIHCKDQVFSLRTKGQLISKCLVGVLNSSKKRTKTVLPRYQSTSVECFCSNLKFESNKIFEQKHSKLSRDPEVIFHSIFHFLTLEFLLSLADRAFRVIFNFLTREIVLPLTIRVIFPFLTREF